MVYLFIYFYFYLGVKHKTNITIRMKYTNEVITHILDASY